MGYAAGVIYKEVKKDAEKAGKREVGVDLGLNEKEKELLHRIVKETIKNHLVGKPVPAFNIDSSTLQEPTRRFCNPPQGRHASRMYRTYPR